MGGISITEIFPHSIRLPLIMVLYQQVLNLSNDFEIANRVLANKFI